MNVEGVKYSQIIAIEKELQSLKSKLTVENILNVIRKVKWANVEKIIVGEVVGELDRLIAQVLIKELTGEADDKK